MSTSRFYYTHNTDSTYPPNGNDDNNDDDDEDKDDDFEYLQDVPYSSSSVDRSSIGSIPWADDAIKQNQIDWEKVERMLCGEETLPEEPELRNEIQEWQTKFPQLVGGRKPSFDSSQTNMDDDFLDIETISNLSLNSLDEDNDEFATPTKERQHNVNESGRPQRRTTETPTNNRSRAAAGDLTKLLARDLCISSVPLTLRKRQRATTNQERSDSSPSPISSPVPPTPPPRRASPMLIVPPIKATSSAIIEPTTRLRMPPILNVLETKRRFRGLANNRSFVQLTQVQQAKSAAITNEPNRRRISHFGNQSAWQLPLAATVSSSFLNNRHSIILPAINLQRIHEHTTTTTSEGGGGGTRSLSNSSLGSGGGERQLYNFMPQRNFNGATTTTSTTPSTGRSISAAVRHPRMEFSAFYLPYRAFK